MLKLAVTHFGSKYHFQRKNVPFCPVTLLLAGGCKPHTVVVSRVEDDGARHVGHAGVNMAPAIDV